MLKTRYVYKDILFLQEYICYLQEGDEICYNIYAPLSKKKNKKKNVHFPIVIYFVYNVNCQFHETRNVYRFNFSSFWIFAEKSEQ